jgi:hypothetical protein
MVSVVGGFVVLAVPIELSLLFLVLVIILACSKRWCSVNAVALCHQASDHSGERTCRSKLHFDELFFCFFANVNMITVTEL